MEEAFVTYLETVFEHPEIIRASVRNIVINRENTEDAETFLQMALSHRLNT